MIRSFGKALRHRANLTLSEVISRILCSLATNLPEWAMFHAAKSYMVKEALAHAKRRCTGVTQTRRGLSRYITSQMQDWLVCACIGSARQANQIHAGSLFRLEPKEWKMKHNKKWSKGATEHSDALDLEEGVFTQDDPLKSLPRSNAPPKKASVEKVALCSRQ